jgi:26S proteasome non-ATPase regulatory subunit 9
MHGEPVADVDASAVLGEAAAGDADADGARAAAVRLMAVQKQIDAAIARHLAVLATHGVDMQTPLVDADGFPRADVDLVAVRTARQRVHALRNDARAILDRLACLLPIAMHGQPTSSSHSPNIPPPVRVATQVPFATVNSVAPNSPAAQAGLCPGDQIIHLAHVTAATGGLNALAAPGIVVHGIPVHITLLRASQPVSICLTPRSDWGGRGLLGCHLLPI